jgi:large subunit ribosomal protein L35
MPKMKSKSGARKRFSLTGTGKVKRHKCNHGHILTKKNAKRKRHLRQSTLVPVQVEDRVKRMLVG